MMMNLVGHATKQKTQKKTICNTTNILPRDFRRFYNKKQMNLVQFLNNATEWDAIVSFDDDNKYIEKTKTSVISSFRGKLQQNKQTYTYWH